MKNKKYINFTLTAIAALTLSACSAVKQADETYKTTDEKVKQTLSANELNNGSLYKIEKNGIYVDKKPIDTHSLDSKSNLPKKFNKSIIVNDQQPKNKEDLASFLTKVTGIKVIIQQDLLNDKTTSSSGSLNPDGSVSSVAGSVVNEVIYNGDAKGLFDHVTSKLNVHWKWDKDADVVEIYKYETKMFSLDALSGINKLSSNLNTASSSSTGSGSGGSGSKSANSGQQTQMENTINIWEEVGASIQAVLGENEKLSLTPSAGKIVVQATPSHMRKVENIVKHLNAFYSKQVRLDVNVYQVEATNEDSYGINWSGVWAHAQTKLGLDVKMGGSLANGVVTVSGKAGAMQNGKAVFGALSKIGKTSLLRNNSVVTINNQPVPLNVAREIAYVQSTSVSTSDNGSSTQINPGVVTEGFSMNLTPLVNDKGEILLQYAIDSSTVEDIEDFSSSDGTSRVQLPTRSISNFLQKVSLKNGESMVLTGFQEVKGNRGDEGIGSAKAWFLGGSREANNKLKTIVVVVTPYIIK